MKTDFWMRVKCYSKDSAFHPLIFKSLSNQPPLLGPTRGHDYRAIEAPGWDAAVTFLFRRTSLLRNREFTQSPHL